MGSAKAWQLEQWERGFNYVADKHVCDECVDDESLRSYIREHATASRCDYCDRDAPSCELDTFMQAIADAIAVDWTDAENEMPYDGGDWALPDANRSIFDLLSEGDLGIDVHPALFDDIVRAFVDRVFAPRYFFDVAPEERLIFGWDAFVHQVTHTTRYLFLILADERPEFPDARRIPPSQMLNEIGATVAENSLFSDLTEGTLTYRARLTDRSRNERPTTAGELGTPPPEHARVSNRMSPNGIAMFYGATDEETAVAETIGSGWPDGHDLTVGVFETCCTLHVVDLVEPPPIPTLFDTEALEARSSLIFLHRFADEVSKLIDRDEREHLEYVPTQIVTEYFRHAFEAEHGIHVDGIRYRSAASDGGECLVLFVDNEECVDTADDGSTVTPGKLALIRASCSLSKAHATS